MLLGAADQRVPHSQGREWVAALQSQPSPPEVGAPSLMLLGAADQRVPHSQGREWVAALQSQPSPPEVGALEY